MGEINLNTLPNPCERYSLVESIGCGVFGQVYKAIDSQASGKSVAIKIRRLNYDTERSIHEEYIILRDFTSHDNIPDFYGIFCEKSIDETKIWFILELCEGGSMIDLVCKLISVEKKMSEEHIAYVLKETIKALIYLHDNKVMHRNVRCSNILVTREGEIKLSDFGVSCQLNGMTGKRGTSVGSPAWMAPEVVGGGGGAAGCGVVAADAYGSRADVWALGITAIEMADGAAPYQRMHPTRALFQIMRNPPPRLAKPSSWSNDINDFISECLEKNPEYRPFMEELMEHPFIQSVPENYFHLSQELKKISLDLSQCSLSEKPQENIVQNGLLLSGPDSVPKIMHVEDLAALEPLTEDSILQELEFKLIRGCFVSFIGDVFLFVNSNTNEDIYGEKYHKKYEFKSRSDNAPHIYAVADSAYQDALHHSEPQHIIFSGESGSGKTTNMLHAIRHLTYLGQMKNNTRDRIEKALFVLQAATHGATLINPNSTRCILQTQVTFGSSGKLSGAIFWLYQLEKWKISTTDMSHANFNLIYYFYDAMNAENQLKQFQLESGRKYRYLRILEDPSKLSGARENIQDNLELFKTFEHNLLDLEFDEEDVLTVRRILASILILGNVRFKEGNKGTAELENPDEALKVAKLLQVDDKKLTWALVNYCLIERGTAVKRKHTLDEARDARDVLASTLYRRVVDWLVNTINFKLSFCRSVFGDKYSISLIDMFGFECFHRNRLEQLIANTMNEQVQFLYNQRMFAWEMQEEEEELVPVISLHFYDNKPAVDQLMGRPMGLFYILDEASRTSGGQEFIMTTIKNSSTGPYLKLAGSHEFSVAHYTGKINYDARDLAEKNRDFLPPEMIETLRSSRDSIIKHLFTCKLTKTGNITVPLNQPKIAEIKNMAEIKARKYNTCSKGQYSQLHRMRTISTTFRATSLDLLKQLSIGPGSGGTHFVRCIRADLLNRPKTFQVEVVRQQLRALAILDTAKARQKGFSSRIPFSEFIKRYKFLAFDFDENVEITKDNCRLLLIRLKMEGWLIGKTKVFLKYYNEEYLSRMYEIQVKKIVKVQCMMRAFLVRRKAAKSKSKLEHTKELQKHNIQNMDENEAATKIQKAFRGYTVRKAHGPLINKCTGQIDEETATFLRRFALKWKSRSIFQVLLQYRAVRYQDLVNLSQQVHIYNQSSMQGLINSSACTLLDRIDPQAKVQQFLGSMLPTVRKLPFRFDNVQYFDSTYLCDPVGGNRDTLASTDSEPEAWDEPLRRRPNTASHIRTSIQNPTYSQSKTSQSTQTGTQSLIHTPYCRDPLQPIKKLAPQPADSPHRKQSTTNAPTVYKKKPAPQIIHYQSPTPWSSQKDNQNNTEFPKLRETKKTDDWQRADNRLPTDKNRNMYGGVLNNNMNNPIKELQEFANSAKAQTSSDDDPPFNFQALLRKTPRNRASMKRVGEPAPLEVGEIPNPMPCAKRTSTKKEKAPLRPKSCQELKRMDSAEKFKLVLTRKDSRKYFNLNGDFDELIELVPGLKVEGKVTDL